MKKEPAVDRHREFVHEFMGVQPSLRAYVLSLVRNFDLADDLLQEIATAAWSQLDTRDATKPFAAWVLGIARHKCVDFLRSRGKYRVVLREDIAESLSERAGRLSDEMAERRKVLAQCIEKLSGSARDVVHLRFGEALHPQEIAGRLGKSMAAVYKILSRARAFLVRCTGHALSPGRG